MRRTTLALAGSALALAVAVTVVPRASAGPSTPATTREQTAQRSRDVMFVGNNWAGTADVVDAHTFQKIGRIDIVPDRAERMQEIVADPARLAFYLAIQQAIGEGHDQLVDDMFSTRDGRLLAVSRPSFADVVWIDLASGAIVKRQVMDGFRTDHMNVSPDGRRLVVSDSTSKSVHEYVLGGAGNPRTGVRLRTFESGETPHESNYSADGRRIFHASIGRVYTPVDAGELDAVGDLIKADRWFQVVRTRDFSIARRWDMGLELEEAGYGDMSSAVRPMAISPDERFAYYQVSFLHGFVEFDLKAADPNGGGDYVAGGQSEPDTGKVTRLIPLPNRVPDLPREQYVLDSAHHGLSMNSKGTKLCVAGTMSDYAAIVTRRTMKAKILDGEGDGEDRKYLKPYWSTEGPGNTCWMSMSGNDAVAVFDLRRRREIAWIPVGDHPQRVRNGTVAAAVERAWHL
ncbi:MAG TPA: serine/threonine protein kinase [Nocardioides sp.]|uniref:YncE family protein n=1 Tax=Nocardioides sp. TaxID=35761 RepID=UPI002D809CB6|nr:serine/threonine protein kinase [Nocardioides sp.]HET6653174.1 serine/threonine protein kinase [Nocardioides sp.]